MKVVAVLACIMVVVAAAPVDPKDKDATVLEFKVENTGIDGYSFNSETSNGIRHQEVGQLKNIGTENEVLEVRGQFSYQGEDGVLYEITYIANEGGFQAFGDHIPKDN